jgi:hypothetical protein
MTNQLSEKEIEIQQNIALQQFPALIGEPNGCRQLVCVTFTAKAAGSSPVVPAIFSTA